MTDKSDKKQPEQKPLLNTDNIKQRTVLGDKSVETKQEVSHSTRFQKGVSGNPKGRPRTKAGAAGRQNKGSFEVSEHAYELAIDQVILAFADKELTVKVGDQLIKMTGREALARAEGKLALSGNAYALKNSQNRIERADRAKLRRQIADATFWQDYKDIKSATLDHLIEEGADIDEEAFLPHPDDIEINEDLTIRFTGPTTPEGLRKCYETMRFREALILQAELDRRLARKHDKTAGMGALCYAKNNERFLPARMRYSDGDWLNAVWRTENINKRTLLKTVKAAWQDAFRDRGGWLDVGVKRGLQFPDINAVQNLLTDLHDVCHEASQNDWHISDDDAAELSDIAGEFGKAMRQ